MKLHPIVAALKKHKAGTAMIVLQIALTLAVMSNAMFMIQIKSARMGRPTGIEEDRIVFVHSDDSGSTTSAAPDAVASRIRADLQAIMHVDGVESAYASNALPLSDLGWQLQVGLTPGNIRNSPISFYAANADTIQSLGLRLLEGRNFTAEEIQAKKMSDVMQPPVVIITRQVAERLFGQSDPLGKSVYFSGATAPSRVIGVVDRLQSPFSQARSDNMVWGAALIPWMLISPERYYVVRSKSGVLGRVAARVEDALYSVDPLRVIPDGTDGAARGVITFKDIREQAYRGDVAVSSLTATVGLVLLFTCSAGIAGLSSFWVRQRRRQIGVRRALGATSNDILRYFLVENLILTGTGVLLGAGLAFVLNVYLMQSLELPRLSAGYVAIGTVVMFVVSICAVLPTALRAARVPPITAIRDI